MQQPLSARPCFQPHLCPLRGAAAMGQCALLLPAHTLLGRGMVQAGCGVGTPLLGRLGCLVEAQPGLVQMHQLPV